jgi:MFS family permease
LHLLFLFFFLPVFPTRAQDFAIFGFLSDILGTVFFPPLVNTDNYNISSMDQEDTTGTTNRRTMESLAVFGGAFLMRPVGGLLIGYMGDVYGRKYALEVSMFLMAGATSTLGCLPSYDLVGDWAVVFLLLVRLFQGLSVGGQLMSSLVFTLEQRPPDTWGLYGSFVLSGANFGTFLGGIVAYWLRSSLTHAQLLAWGWRVPFLSGFGIAFCGLYLRYYCDENDADRLHGHGPVTTTSGSTRRRHPALHCPLSTLDDDDVDVDVNVNKSYHDKENDEALHYRHPHNTNNNSSLVQHEIQSSHDDDDDDDDDGMLPPLSPRKIQSRVRSTPGALPGPPINPLQIAFSKANLRSLLASAMVPLVWGGGFYFSFVWLAIYMTDMVSPPIPSAFGVNSCSLLLMQLWFPLAGKLSDKFGRRTIMTIGGLAFGGLGPLMVIVIASATTSSSSTSSNTSSSSSNSSMWIAFGAQIILGISLSLWGAPMCAWLVEAFDPVARLTSVAIGYNVAQAIAGGFSPLVATLLVDKVSTTSPGSIIAILSVLSLTGLWCVAPPPLPSPRHLPPRETSMEEDGTEMATTKVARNHVRDHDAYPYNNDTVLSVQEGIVSLECKEII